MNYLIPEVIHLNASYSGSERLICDRLRVSPLLSLAGVYHTGAPERPERDQVIHIGRSSRPKFPLDNRICKFCSSSAIKDEEHFLSSCGHYADLRLHIFAFLRI